MAAATAPSSGASAVERAADAVLRSFDRVVGQRVVVDHEGVDQALVLGVRHRRPASCTVSGAVADELGRRGVPSVVAGRPGGSVAPW